MYLPHLNLLEATIPGRKFTMEFDAGTPGTYELYGSQMCGYTHPNLIGNLVVHTRSDFERWLESLK